MELHFLELGTCDKHERSECLSAARLINPLPHTRVQTRRIYDPFFVFFCPICLDVPLWYCDNVTSWRGAFD